MNKCFFSGNVTRDPEIKNFGDSTLAKFSIAVPTFKKVNGRVEKSADFLDFDAWGNSAKFLADYVKKGDMVFVEAYAVVDKWEDSEGLTRSKVIFKVDNIESPRVRREEPEPEVEEKSKKKAAPKAKKETVEVSAKTSGNYKGNEFENINGNDSDDYFDQM